MICYILRTVFIILIKNIDFSLFFLSYLVYHSDAGPTAYVRSLPSSPIFLLLLEGRVSRTAVNYSFSLI